MSRILIADADALLRAALGLVLQKKLGVTEIVEVTDPDQLETSLEEGQPDAIVLDYNLPGLAEAGGLARYRPLMPAPVIALSIRTEDGPSALAAGADDFIYKSFAPEQVLAIIKKYVA
jgi:two-component system KDP operon response regulator KdpE